MAVTRSLPYTQTATTQERRRDRLDTMIEFTMMAEQWNAIKRNDIQLNGVPAVREQLNIEVRPHHPGPSERNDRDGQDPRPSACQRR